MSGAFESVRARYDVTPIRGCPGRYIIHGESSQSPEALIVEPVSVRRYVGRSRDTVCVVALADGGIISYAKSDGTFVHTLCDADGFVRKLEQLRIRPGEL